MILDEDELKETLDENIITKQDYYMAYNTCNRLMKDINTNKDTFIAFFNKYLIDLL